MKKRKKMFMTFLLAMLFGLLALCEEANASESETISQRLAIAEEAGVSEWVDEEGYLIDEFFLGKTEAMLSDLGLDELIYVLSEEEVDAYVSMLNAGISLLSVTRSERTSQVDPESRRYVYAAILEVDGILAFCVDREADTPAKGSVTGPWELVENEDMRKILYYGYNGPEDQGYQYVETTLAAAVAEGTTMENLGVNAYEAIRVLPAPPEDFYVWRVQTNNGLTQDLVFYTTENSGEAKIKKQSALESITEGNPCYSLASAVYGVYEDQNCTILAGEFTTEETGESNTLTLVPGKYYMKELEAPMGYELNTEVLEFEVALGETTVLEVTDNPKTICPGIAVQKIDKETGELSPQENASFEGALFEVSFYSASYTASAIPDKTWVMKTDSNGQICFSEVYKVSGDAFWEDTEGNIILPLGTLTVRELLSPKGYCLNTEIFVQNLATGFETVMIPEQLFRVKIKKVNDIGKLLANTEFTIYSDAACEKEIMKGTTNADGEIVFTGLTVNKNYYIKETKAPEGYSAAEELYEIYADGSEAQALIEKTIVNQRIYKLPETGSRGSFLLQMIGIGCLIMAKKKRQEE